MTTITLYVVRYVKKTRRVHFHFNLILDLEQPKMLLKAPVCI